MPLVLTVKDTGMGIPKSMLGHVCLPFVQVGQGASREHGGVGLGLSISKRLAEAMHGHIDIRSTEGKGTTVQITLPLSVSSATLPARESPSDAPPAKGQALHILAVEDDIINLTALELALEKMGHFVACASNGSEALESLSANGYDCVLMDLQMPGMDGLTATKKIRSGEAGKRNSGIPIIAITGFAMSGDRERFLKAGLTEYISKPVELRDLGESLEKVAAPAAPRAA